MWYPLLRRLLFTLEAETAHRVTLRSLNALRWTGLCAGARSTTTDCARNIMGLDFPNPVGFAAGLDKNGEFIDALAVLGFGFLEVGTVTPRPQPGNPRPRLFRIPAAQALVNRMGFNNCGVEQFVRNVQRAASRGVLGINIGKNFDTPIERAADDYLYCLRRVYPFASYVTVNISSPNTTGLRQLQETDRLDRLLIALKTERQKLADDHRKYVPLALKVAPDLDSEEVKTIADCIIKHAFDAVIATNTTVNREGVAGLPHSAESGGLSGAPLAALSTDIVRQFRQALGGSKPVIGVGGVMSGADAAKKMAAGASLVQIYTGLVYRGPDLVGECIETLCKTGIQSS